VAELHQWLAERRAQLPDGNFADAELFLLKLDRALNAISS
jgi:hypothetical protein